MPGKRCFVMFALTMATAAGGCTTAGDSVVLRPRWEVGQLRYVEWHLKTALALRDVGDPARVVSMTAWETIGCLCRITEQFPGGGVRLEVTFDRLLIGDDFDGKPKSCDSDLEDLSSSDHPFCKVMHSVLGKSYTVELDNNGHVIRVDGLEEILEAVKRAAGDAPAVSTAAADLDAVSHSAMWNMLYAGCAFGEVKAGDTWTRIIETYRGMNEYRFTVDHIGTRNGRQVVTVKHTAKAVASSKAPRAEALLGVRYSGRQMKAGGTVLFNVERQEVAKVCETGEERAKVKSKDPSTGQVTTNDERLSWEFSIAVFTKGEREEQKTQRRAGPES